MESTNQFMALPNFKFCPSRVRRRDEKNNSSVFLLAVRGEGACARGFRLFSCAEIALYYTALDIYIYTADGPSLGARAPFDSTWRLLSGCLLLFRSSFFRDISETHFRVKQIYFRVPLISSVSIFIEES